MTKLPRRNVLRAGEYANRCRPQYVVQELIDAAKGLQEDLLMRAERDKHDGGKVVNASHGKWVRFCEAIRRAEVRA